MDEKPLCSRPHFFPVICFACGGCGKELRSGPFRGVCLRFFGSLIAPCDVCRGRGEITYVLTRSNLLTTIGAWEYTTDGWYWLSVRSYEGREITWAEIDRDQCILEEAVEDRYLIEGLDFEVDDRGRRVDTCTGKVLTVQTNFDWIPA